MEEIAGKKGQEGYSVDGDIRVLSDLSDLVFSPSKITSRSGRRRRKREIKQNKFLPTRKYSAKKKTKR